MRLPENLDYPTPQHRALKETVDDIPGLMIVSDDSKLRSKAVEERLARAHGYQDDVHLLSTVVKVAPEEPTFSVRALNGWFAHIVTGYNDRAASRSLRAYKVSHPTDYVRAYKRSYGVWSITPGRIYMTEEMATGSLSQVGELNFNGQLLPYEGEATEISFIRSIVLQLFPSRETAIKYEPFGGLISSGSIEIPNKQLVKAIRKEAKALKNARW